MTLRSQPRTLEDEFDAPLLAEINVTPMVDVMLVLLIIFMVAAPLMLTGVKLDLPRNAGPPITPPHAPLVLSLDPAGHVFIGGAAVADVDLTKRLTALAAADPAQTIYVRADKATSYGTVMHAMGAVAAAGFAHISLLAIQSQPPGTGN
jgi:biopolymer transport protein TolR